MNTYCFFKFALILVYSKIQAPSLNLQNKTGKPSEIPVFKSSEQNTNTFATFFQLLYLIFFFLIFPCFKIILFYI